MPTTEYIVTASDVGRVFAERNGFLLSLVRSREPSGDCYARPWQERCLTLRDSMSPQALFHLDVTTAGRTPLCIGGAHYHVVNSSIPYFGDLKLVHVPYGSEFEITISDVYVPPRVPIKQAMWYGNYVPHNPPVPPLPRQLEHAAPPLRLSAPLTVTIEQGR